MLKGLVLMNKQIMVVDDETNMLALIDIILKRRGFSVLKASNARAALELLASSTPDLFILDVMMPGMDGIELCKQIRARPDTADIPVIMLSANVEPSAVKRGLEAGANEYLPKVTHHSALLAKVNDILGIPQNGTVQ